jgi:hypothetical protein
MKLSSRKQLLEEADEVLSEIRKSINEFDWKSHEDWLRLGSSSTKEHFLRVKLEKELKQIEDRYKDKDDPVSKQKEIDELTQFMDKLTSHLRNRKAFSRNPEEQSELEKMIINTPHPTTMWSDDISKYLIKDPKTGMYYHKVSGRPDLSPEMYPEFEDWLTEWNNSYKWDKTRGWFYNILMIILTGRE